MLAIAVSVGLVVGVVMGTLGGGGAVLSVPILVFGFSQAPHDATTASLIIVGTGAIAGVLAHHRRRTVKWRTGLLFGALGTPAAVAGSWISGAIDPDLLLAAFAALLVLVAVLMLRQARKPESATTEREPRGPATIVLTALGIGLLTGFFGVGGGFAMVPALVLVLGFRMPVAVGTSLLVMTINSAAALLTRAVDGLHGLDWWLIGCFAAAAVVGNLLGGRLTGRISSNVLQRAFAVLLLLVAVYTAVRAGTNLAG